MGANIFTPAVEVSHPGQLAPQLADSASFPGETIQIGISPARAPSRHLRASAPRLRTRWTPPAHSSPLKNARAVSSSKSLPPRHKTRRTASSAFLPSRHPLLATLQSPLALDPVPQAAHQSIGRRNRIPILQSNGSASSHRRRKPPSQHHLSLSSILFRLSPKRPGASDFRLLHCRFGASREVSKDVLQAGDPIFSPYGATGE